MTNYDKIAASRPVNAQAAKQLGGGTHWSPKITLQDWYDTIPPMKPSEYYVDRSAEWIDFRGRVFGRLTVIGTMDRESESGGASWVCRCVCGCYCTRKTKSLKVAERGGNSFVDRCGRCDYQRRLASGWSPK